MAHPANGPGEALSVRETAVHGNLPRLHGEPGLPLPLRGPELPILQIVLVPSPERMPRRAAKLGNGACRARVELDVGLDCQPALLCAVHAVLRATFSWSRITTAVPTRNSEAIKHTPVRDRVGKRHYHQHEAESMGHGPDG